MHRPKSKNQQLFKSVLSGTWKVAKLTHRCAEATACAVGRWLISSSRQKHYIDTSLFSLWDNFVLMLIRAALTAIGMALTVFIVFLMVAKGIPFLITGNF